MKDHNTFQSFLHKARYYLLIDDRICQINQNRKISKVFTTYMLQKLHCRFGTKTFPQVVKNLEAMKNLSACQIVF